MALTVVEFIFQSASAPLSFCHRMSASPPSPTSKSAVALTCQSGVTNGSVTSVTSVLLLKIQRTSSPAWSRQRMSASIGNKSRDSSAVLKSERWRSVNVVMIVLPCVMSCLSAPRTGRDQGILAEPDVASVLHVTSVGPFLEVDELAFVGSAKPCGPATADPTRARSDWDWDRWRVPY